MFQTTTQEISLIKFPNLCQVTTLSEPNYSIHFCIGYSLLKLYLRSKEFHQKFAIFQETLQKTVSILEFSCAQESKAHLSLYTSILNTLQQSTNFPETESWLKSCIDPKYASSVSSIIFTGQHIAYYLCSTFNSIYEETLANNPYELFKYISDYFSIYVHLIWDDSDYLYEPTSQQESFLIYIYYNLSSKHFYLLHESGDKLDAVEVFQQTYRESVVNVQAKRKDVSNSMASMSTFQDSVHMERLQNFPYLLQMMQNMLQVLIENGVYTAEVKNALRAAVDEDEFLMSLQRVKNVVEGQEPFCEEHKNDVYVRFGCKEKHCQECVFKKILNEFNRVNYKIYCPCGIQIAPKEVDEIKKDAKYQEFCVRNKKSE